ncbi:MAG: hypothetical protein C5B59_16985 [Bacteroidetes bacterium]|nr:MAG: hypothetical protein C5B59_16985 [Bacteroidota bacterium]
MFNGQVLIGNVKEASLGTITIDEMDLKLLTIKLYKIRRLRIVHHFKIETVDKKLYYGLINPTDKDGWVEIETGYGKVAMPITNIFSLISLDKNFFRRLNGNVSAGLSYAKSSNIGQVNFSALLQFATRLLDNQLTASELGSIDSGRYSRDNESLQLFSAYQLNTSWFVTVVGQYQRNLELTIARRLMGIGGIGNKVVVRDNWSLFAVTGFAFSQERSTAGVNSGLLIEIPFMLRFNLFQFRKPDLQINSTQTAYFGLTEAGRFRADGNTSASWQLIRDFYLSLSPYTNFDSNPPSASSSKFDYGVVFSLTYKF